MDNFWELYMDSEDSKEFSKKFFAWNMMFSNALRQALLCRHDELIRNRRQVAILLRTIEISARILDKMRDSIRSPWLGKARKILEFGIKKAGFREIDYSKKMRRREKQTVA